MTDVLVCGAGPVGLFFAIILKQTYPNAKVRIIERSKSNSQYSKAMGIQSRAVEHLSYLKGEFFNMFLERGLKATEFSIKSGNSGEDVSQLTLDSMSSPYSYLLMMAQYETEGILEKALADLGIKVERQVQLTSFEQQPGQGDQAIKVSLENLALNTREETECRYLIGADGGKSNIRKSLNLKFEGNVRSEVFFMGDVEIESDWLEPFPNVFMGDSGICGLLPFPEKNWWRVITNLSPDDPILATHQVQVGVDKNNQDVHDELKIEHLEAIAKARTHREFKFTHSKWLTTFKVNERIVEKYQVGRVFLMGDAAHVHSPAGGQGMNLGLQDAFNLAWKLGLVLKGVAKESLLETYGLERRPIAHDVVKWSSRQTDMMGMSIFSKFVRSHILLPLLPVVLSIIPVTQFTEGLGQLKVHYDPNGIIHPGSSSFILSGDKIKNGSRAPSLGQFENQLAPLQSALLPFHKATGSFLDLHLVVAPAVNAGEIDWSLWKGAWKDEEEKVSSAYGFKATSKVPHLVLVRPDGYISWQQSGHELAELTTFLNNFLITA